MRRDLGISNAVAFQRGLAQVNQQGLQRQLSHRQSHVGSSILLERQLGVSLEVYREYLLLGAGSPAGWTG